MNANSSLLNVGILWPEALNRAIRGLLPKNRNPVRAQLAFFGR
jgi:hypothetical protein